MELPRRKKNRLCDYDYSTNGAYFVTICTQDRRKLLSEIVGDDAHIVPYECKQKEKQGFIYCAVDQNVDYQRNRSSNFSAFLLRPCDPKPTGL